MNYNAEKFCSDISHVPWKTLDLMDSLDERVDGFNNLFLACLNDHAPIKTIKVKRRSIPFITDDIRKMITTRNNLHRIARQSGHLRGYLRWQGWRSGESTCLPPMWPGFDFRSRRHMWVEFVGSLLCSERFFPGYSGFPLSSKTTFDLI